MARRWLEQAAQGGNCKAHVHLAWLAMEQGDVAGAVEHLGTAALEGDEQAIESLCRLCREALGT